ncbi:MAG: hypothetical protein Q7S47_00675 [bacterium]|nr:hypothetical protein [bacterium]
MAQNKIFISKLSIPGKQNDELSYVFSDRIPGSESDSPVLFGVFHFFGTSEIYHSIIKETVKHFLDFFHRSKKSLSGSLTDSSFESAEFIFENAIQYTNEHVTQYLLEQQETSEKHYSFDMKRVNFVLGALFGDTLFLSITGSHISPVYIYPVFRKEGFSHYAVLPIGEDSKDGTESQRLFSNIVSGKLSIQGSTFVMCNHHFLDYISLEQIKQAVTNMSIQNLSSYFEGLLGKVHGKNDFAALFINPHYTGPIPQETRPVSTATNRSMAGLNSTAQGTNSILTPSVLSPFKPIAKTLFDGAIMGIQKGVQLLWKGIKVITAFIVKAIKEKRVNPAEILAATQHSISALSKNVLSTSTTVTKLFNASTRSVALEKISLGAREFFASFGQNAKSSITSLSRTSKALLVLGVIFALLFIQSLVSIKHKQTAERQWASYQELTRVIELKADLADASLLYDNGDKAQTIIAEANALLAQLPQTENVQKAQFARLSDRINTIRAKMSHATLITAPQKVASLQDQIPNAGGLFMTGNGSSIVLYSQDSVYTLDTSSGKASQIETQAKLPLIRCAAGIDPQTFYFCTGESNRLGVVDLIEKTVKTVAVDFNEKEKSMWSIALYNNRLYVLDPISSMIYRHQKKGDQFDAGAAWIKQLSDPLTNALNLSLDGSVFILTSGTTVAQYASGKPVPFQMPALEPALTQATRIFTSEETSSLFLLEPVNKRILVIDKKTKLLKNQFVSDTFTNLKDIFATKKDLFILNGSDVFKIPL